MPPDGLPLRGLLRAVWPVHWNNSCYFDFIGMISTPTSYLVASKSPIFTQAPGKPAPQPPSISLFFFSPAFCAVSPTTRHYLLSILPRGLRDRSALLLIVFRRPATGMKEGPGYRQRQASSIKIYGPKLSSKVWAHIQDQCLELIR